MDCSSFYPLTRIHTLVILLRHGSWLTDIYQRIPHAYTTPSCPDVARCWVPCVDSMWEKCTWEFEFVVPRYLEERDGDEPEEFEEQQGEYTSVVVCSGELVEQVKSFF
jgi:hypothetical protein